ncbi:MAG: dihydrolipoyl dehydrogenase [Oligoflexia bacterium]|nr:dihydrolipoyl dehydrogenase [Oligoflexia bacterium]MBF0364726.1 dihydrolipoyl dehydrogenase [Oligoflexia bacterium]
MSLQFDVVVIGSGPGGYTAAIKAAQSGFKTAIIEKYKVLGGTCLQVGCIPAKTYLSTTELMASFHHKAKDMGLNVSDALFKEIDFKTLQKRVSDVVLKSENGINYLMKKNGVEVFCGHATFVDAHTLALANQEKELEIKAKYIIIATGSKPLIPELYKLDGERVISSTEALKLSKIPKRLGVIGGGAIGLELGSVFSRLGSSVSVIEYSPRIIMAYDEEMSKTLASSLKKQGLKFFINSECIEVEGKQELKLTLKNRTSGEISSVEVDTLLIATGRRPYTEGLGLEKVGVKLNARKFIEVDSELRTFPHPHIYAIGDVIGGSMLAHKAEEEAIAVIERMKGEKPHINYDAIPGVIYTWPEVASVGLREEDAKAKNIPYKVGIFPFSANARGRIHAETEGVCKVVTHKESDQLLGVHYVGPHASELIASAVIALEFKASAEDLARVCYPHPTLSEVLREASSLAFRGKTINY